MSGSRKARTSRKGQVLFEIQRTQYEASLQSARAQLAKAQAELARAQEQVEVLRARAELEQRQAALAKAKLDVARLKPLAQAKAVPQVDLDNALAAEQVAVAGVAAAQAALKDTELNQRIGIQQAQAAVEAGRAAVTQAQLDLAYTTIRAPVSGIIGRLDVDEGNLVGRGEPTLLATMSTVDPIKVSTTVSEVDYLRFARRAAGRTAADEQAVQLELVLADGTLHPHKGRVTTLDRTVDPKTGTIVFEALFPNPEKLLRPGQFGRVRAVVEVRENAILVPQRAVQETQGQKTVLVVDQGDKVALRSVTLNERIGDLIIVTRGLEGGERVIVEGLQKVRPGMQVKPEAAPPAGTPPAAGAADAGVGSAASAGRGRRRAVDHAAESARGQAAGRRLGPMAQFFIGRPIVAIVIAILTVLLGTASLLKLAFEQYPFLAPPSIRVTATYPGASAVAVEQSVATPIEQEVNGVDKMIYMQSSNTSDGRMLLDVSFEVGVDQDTANVLTQNRVTVAQARLPQEVIQQGVTVKKQSPSILMVISVNSPGGSYDANFLINYCGINLRDQILRIPGIAQVDLFGGTDYGMRVWLEPNKLAKLGLTPADVISAIKEQNLQAPAGRVGGAPSPKDQQFTYTVAAPGRLITTEEFENIIIRGTATAAQVRIKDVGRAELGSQDYNSFGRLDGKPAGAMAVYLLPGANQLEASKRIYETMARAKTLFPPDMDYKIVYDTTPAVEASIESIVHTFVEALILVTLVVFIFLQNVRATIIPLLTVPVSIIGTFIFFPMLGFSVNTLSMFGLVLAIGIVVDDAIVVVEAVIHHMEHGLDPRAATIQAMKEVSGPVVGIALILSAVFVPVAFLGGLTGRMYQQFALTIAISVLLSAFSALSLSPALSVLLLKPGPRTRARAARHVLPGLQLGVRPGDQRLHRRGPASGPACGADDPDRPRRNRRRRALRTRHPGGVHPR